jgi:hypothetical protein
MSEEGLLMAERLIDRLTQLGWLTPRTYEKRIELRAIVVSVWSDVLTQLHQEKAAIQPPAPMSKARKSE